MTSTTYIPQEHTHVLLDGVLDDQGSAPLFPIIHHTDDYVWVMGSYSNEIKESDNICPVGALGRSEKDTYDSSGNLVLSVPVRHIKCYMNEDEAVAASICLHANEG